MNFRHSKLTVTLLHTVHLVTNASGLDQLSQRGTAGEEYVIVQYIKLSRNTGGRRNTYTEGKLPLYIT